MRGSRILIRLMTGVLLAFVLGACANSESLPSAPVEPLPFAPVEPLPSAPVDLHTIPLVAVEAVEPMRRMVLIIVDGLGAELCRERSSLPDGGSLRRLLDDGCRPLTPGVGGALGDRASLMTGVEPGTHGVFSDSSVQFRAPQVGERHWPSGPRRAPHAFDALIKEQMGVVVVGAVHDYPPPKAPFLHFVAGAALPREMGAGPVWDFKEGVLWGGVKPVELVPGVVSRPVELTLTRSDGLVREVWTRALWDGDGEVIFAPHSAHPLSPSLPLAWPPSTALDLWNAGVALRSTQGALRGLSGETEGISSRAGAAFARFEALEILRASAVLLRTARPALTIVHLPRSVHLAGDQGRWLEELDAELTALLPLAGDASVLLISLRGRSHTSQTLPEITLEDGLKWSGPGSIRAERGLPPARRRGALKRTASVLRSLPGIDVVIQKSDVAGPVAGLAPDLQLVAKPGFALRSELTDIRAGVVAGSSVGRGGGVGAARIGGWLPDFVRGASAITH